MLKSGDKVNLYYYEGEDQVESFNWIVEEYDNGLLKVSKPSENIEVTMRDTGEPVPEPEEGESDFKLKVEATKPVIFNLRSTGFLRAELI